MLLLFCFKFKCINVRLQKMFFWVSVWKSGHEFDEKNCGIAEIIALGQTKEPNSDMWLMNCIWNEVMRRYTIISV